MAGREKMTFSITKKTAREFKEFCEGKYIRNKSLLVDRAIRELLEKLKEE